jgi:NADPH-dependent glutamate synthase beta subunit-like oxidoreductase/ferredoxin
MISLKIDNKEIEVPAGTTVLEAATLSGISIPSMCFLKGHSNHPACMVCLVKDNRNGALVPSCALVATNGMDLNASDPDVLEARRKSLELLMSDHVGDCEAPCSLACPANMEIPLMNRLIGEGRFTDALNVVKDDIALPYILGYICPAPCEKACRRKQIDEPVSICVLKRFSASAGSDNKALAASRKLNLISPEPAGKIAIIGSGPAGLAAAYYLQIYGHSCTLFDKASEPGGTLRSDIPDEELPKNIIDLEVEIIRSMGAAFRFNTLVTEEFYNSDIKDSFDAVIIASGDTAAGTHFANLIASTKTGYQTDEKNMSSSLPGIFVCGSAIRPHKMAVRSVAQGKTAASSVHAFLHQKHFEKPAKIFNSRFDKLLPAEYSEYLKESIPDRRVMAVSGYTGGFSEAEAILEAQRCLHCDCRKKDDCKLRNNSDEYKIERKRFQVGNRKAMTKKVQHDLVVFEPEKCIKCGLCVEISSGESEKYGLAFEGRGFDVVVNSPLGVSFSEGLNKTAIECVTSCPTGALSFKNSNNNNER